MSRHSGVSNGRATSFAGDDRDQLSLFVSLSAVATAIGLALALVLAFGGVGTWAVLRAPPVPYLRSE